MKTDGVDEVIKRLPQMEQLFNGIVSLNGVAKGLTIWNYRFFFSFFLSFFSLLEKKRKFLKIEKKIKKNWVFLGNTYFKINFVDCINV